MPYLSNPLYQKLGILFTVIALIVISTAPVAAQGGATQTYVSLDGTVAFDFPDGWIADELFDGLMRISNSQAVLDADSSGGEVPPLASGEVLLIVLTPSLIEDALGLDATTSPFDMVAEYTNPFETINEYQAHGRSIAYAAADLDKDEGLTFGVEIGGGISSIMVATHAVGEQDVHFDTFLAIAESIHDPDFPLATTDDDNVVSTDSAGTFITDDSGLSMSTPAGWRAGQLSDSVFISFSDDNGGVRMLILPPNRVAQEIDVSNTSTYHVATEFATILDRRYGGSVGNGQAAFLEVGQSIRVDSSYNDRDEVVLAVQLDTNNYAVVIASMPAGMRDTYEPQIFAIVESFSISGEVTSEPSDGNALTQEYVDNTVGFEFMVPDGWVWHSFSEDTDVDDVGIMIFADSEATYTATFIDDELAMAENAVMMLVINPDLMYLLISLDLGPDATADDTLDELIEVTGTVYDMLEDRVTYEGNRNTVIYVPFESNGLFGVYGLVDLGDGNYVGFRVYAENRDHTLYIDTILAIADTMIYTG